MRTRVLLLTLGLLLTIALFPLEDSKADDPDYWTVGDTWVYGTIYGDDPANVTRYHTLRVQSRTDETGYVMLANGSLDWTAGNVTLIVNMTSVTHFDISTRAEMASRVNITHNDARFNYYANATFSPGLRYLNLPLFVGKAWNFTTHAEVETNATFTDIYPLGPDNLTYEFYVEGETDVTVPAGTFHTYVVLMNYSQESDPGATDRYRYYYSEDVMNVVRMEARGAEEGQGMPFYPQYHWLGVTYAEIKDTPLVLCSYSPNSAEPPTQLTPPDGSLLMNTKPEFSWQFSDAEGDEQRAFVVDIDDRLDFTSVDRTSGVVISTAENWTPEIPLAGGSWYWRVQTQDDRGLWSNASVSSFTVDLWEPYLVYVLPDDGSRHWNVSGNIFVSFSERMNTTSVEEAFTLTSGGQGIEGTFIWLSEGSHLRFNVTQGFKYGTEYNIIITTEARDLVGNTLNVQHESTFRTRDIAESDSNWDFTSGIILVTLIPALALAIAFFLRMKKDREDVEEPPEGKA